MVIMRSFAVIDKLNIYNKSYVVSASACMPAAMLVRQLETLVSGLIMPRDATSLHDYCMRGSCRCFANDIIG